MWPQLVMALIGQAGEAKSKEEQNRMMQDALARLRDIPLPELKAMIAEQLGRPEAAQGDPLAMAAQRDALAKMQQYASGQVTPEDRAQLALSENEAARRGQIQQNAILQNALQRGQVGSGTELALRQNAANAQSDDAYNAALKNMIDMRQRAYNATGQVGQLASHMSDQDYRRKAAADAVAMANARARAGAQQYNLGLSQKNYENAIGKWAKETGRTDKTGELGAANAREQSATLGNFGAGIGKLTEEDKKDEDNPYNRWSSYNPNTGEYQT